jgi:hypothetical protein
MAIKVIKGNSPALSLLRTLRRGLEMVVVWAVGKDMLACGEACKLWGVCDRLEQGRQDRREYSSFKNDVENCALLHHVEISILGSLVATSLAFTPAPPSPGLRTEPGFALREEQASIAE